MAAIDFTATARRDITNAMAWEDERGEDLGKRMLEYVVERVIALSVTPALGTVRYGSTRGTNTRKFQYQIHYRFDEQTDIVTILRVLHTSRKPVWKPF